MFWIIVSVLVVELIFRPRIDITTERQILLWYGRKNRMYFFIKK